jgi:predicted TIM-barrel fold metal-dependent hydrolase
MAEKIKVVDAHHHLWDLDRHAYGWLNGPNKGVLLRIEISYFRQ